MTVLHVAEKNGFTVEEKDIPLSEVSHYDGAFVTSTSAKIVPITQIDEVHFSIPEKLKELMSLYDEFLETSKGEFHG
jgi:branched-subunit amino acid aminotransferase/4-amino-4-deoxychorismate lyase